jgi:hypothetical protein
MLIKKVKKLINFLNVKLWKKLPCIAKLLIKINNDRILEILKHLNYTQWILDNN